MVYWHAMMKYKRAVWYDDPANKHDIKNLNLTSNNKLQQC
jgi:hypothetical protein